MISVQEATTAIFAHPPQLKTTTSPIEIAVGKVLAEGIYADRDFPPFNRVTMDGIAINFDEWQRGRRSFPIEKTVAAGTPQATLNFSHNAVEVMTGALVPKGTDTIIRYEDLIIKDGIALIQDVQITNGQSIHRQGQDAKKSDTLLEAGIRLSAAEIALLASVGKQEVKVYDFPTAAIIGSGDELVAVKSVPQPHQIRRSNTYAIQAAMQQLGWHATQHHISDDRELLRTSLQTLLHEHDVLVLSGGVSKGKFDFIPAVLEELGVKKIFHEVSQRPGKPFWFGIKNEKRILPFREFGIHIYVLLQVHKTMGSQECHGGETPALAILAKDFSFTPKLTYFLQVQVKNEGGKLVAYPGQGGGSGDFANLKKIDGFLELPLEKTDFKAGEVFPFIPFRA